MATPVSRWSQRGRCRDLPGQAFEKLAHCHKIQLVGAVENHRLDGESLSQIFGGFCFSCARRTGGSSSKLEVKGARQGQVASEGGGKNASERLKRHLSRLTGRLRGGRRVRVLGRKTHLSVSGVMTSRPEFPRYSYPYKNSAFTARMYRSSLAQ